MFDFLQIERNLTRRLAVAGFALFYALLVFSTTAERSSEAVADTPNHTSSSHHDASSGKLKEAETHLKQTKINEPGFIVEVSREAAAIPIVSERLVPVSTFQFRSAWSGPLFSSRAPPILL